MLMNSFFLVVTKLIVVFIKEAKSKNADAADAFIFRDWQPAIKN